jgi:hypothetical protein
MRGRRAGTHRYRSAIASNTCAAGHLHIATSGSAAVAAAKQ